jgi:hypothetical protein
MGDKSKPDPGKPIRDTAKSIKDAATKLITGKSADKK